MKKQLFIFTIIQVFFCVLFGLLSTNLVQADGLQPLNSKEETVHVNLNERASIKDIQAISREYGLNIAYYDNVDASYYIDFSTPSNPARIYGVATSAFLHVTFTTEQCASTVASKGCSIQLSVPNKAINVTIYPLDKLDDSLEITSFVLYPDVTASAEQQETLIKNKYGSSTFVTSLQFPDQLLPILLLIFLFTNVLILLSLLQTIYRSGHQIGISKLMGQPFVQTCLRPLVSLDVFIGIILLLSYVILHTFLTFDWAYLQFIALYCCLTFLIYSAALSFTYVTVNLQRINSLIKGIQKSKFLIRLFVTTSFVSLLFSGVLLPVLSNQMRALYGLYQTFTYYETTLTHAGVLMPQPEEGDARATGDEAAIARQKQVTEYFAPYVHTKRMGREKYFNREGYFPTVGINKNLVFKYFADDVHGIDLDDENTTFVFTSDAAGQQEQLATMQEWYNLPARDKKLVIVEYDNPQMKEFIEDKTAGPLQFREIKHPIYLYNPRADRYDIEEGRGFTDRYGLGSYIDLESAEASRKWENLERQLEAWGIAQYYKKPVTLAQTSQDLIQTAWIFIGTMLLIFIFSLLGVIILIYTWLQEYFRMNRKRLILEKVFGRTFLDRYGILLASMLITFTSAWVTATFMQKEWVFINVGLFIFLITTLYVLTKYQIIRLERASTNIVIKE